jgi:hypothetical protein
MHLPPAVVVVAGKNQPCAALIELGHFTAAVDATLLARLYLIVLNTEGDLTWRASEAVEWLQGKRDEPGKPKRKGKV